MKTTIVMCSVLLMALTGLHALSIYDIQYTSSRGVDNSYPSPYLGKEVTVEGIVTASTSSGFYLSETVSGAWRGIFVSSSTQRPATGNLVRVSGEVGELFGMTCIQNLASLKVLDRNRSVPAPIYVSTGQLTNPLEAEAYECVRVRVINASAANNKIKNDRFMVNDGSGLCSVNLKNYTAGRITTVPSQFSQLTGIVVFGYGEYSLNPTTPSDMQAQQPVSTQNRSWGKIKSIYK